MKRGPCAQHALGVTFDVSLAVLSGQCCKCEEEREIVRMRTGPCAQCALSVTFDASWTGCALRQGCKSDEEEEREIVHMKVGLVLDMHSVLHLMYLGLAVLSGSAASVTASSAWLLHLTAVYSFLAEQKLLGNAGSEVNKITYIRHLSDVALIHSSCSVPGVGSPLVVFSTMSTL